MIALWFYRLRPYLIAAAFLWVIALWLHSRREVDYSNDAYDALAKVYNRRMVADSFALDSARVQLSAKSGQVTRDVVKYRTIRDSFDIHDTAQVIVFRDRADSLVRSCMELQPAAAFVVSDCAAAQTSLRLDRDLWKTRFEGSNPSKWDTAKEWAIRIGIGYGAYKLAKH